jgi:hypothetical protein
MIDWRTTLARAGTPAALSLAALTLVSPVQAHPGHGEDGSHWHASDLFGFVLLAAVALGVLGWWRGRK